MMETKENSKIGAFLLYGFDFCANIKRKCWMQGNGRVTAYCCSVPLPEDLLDHVGICLRLASVK